MSPARGVALGLRLALHLEAERDVVEHAPVREQTEVSGTPSTPRSGAARAATRASSSAMSSPSMTHLARGRLDEPAEAADERRLARARQPHHDEHVALGHVEAHVADGGDAAGARFELGARQIGVGRVDDALRVRSEHLPHPAARDRRRRCLSHGAHPTGWMPATVTISQTGRGGDEGAGDRRVAGPQPVARVRGRAGRRRPRRRRPGSGAATDVIPTEYSSTVHAWPSARRGARPAGGARRRASPCARCKRSSPSRAVRAHRGVGARREEHDPARHDVERELLAGPVAQGHVLVAVHLVEVEHRPRPGGDRDAGRLADVGDEHLEVGRARPTSPAAGSAVAARSVSAGPIR